MAWLLLAFCLAIVPNQALLAQLPRGPGGLRLQDLSILLAGLLLFVTFRRPRGVAPRAQALLPWVLVAYGLLSLAATFTAPFITHGVAMPRGLDDPRVQLWRDEITGIAMFFVASRCVRSEEEVRKVLLVLLIASAYFVVQYLFRYFPESHRIFALPRPPDTTAAEWAQEQRWMIQGISGVFTKVGASEMAAYYVYVAIFCAGLGWEYRSRLWRTILNIETAVMVVGVVWSASKVALLACAGAAAYAFVRQKKWVVRAAILGIAALSWSDGAAVRLGLWAHAIVLGVKHPFGVGYHAFAEKHREVYAVGVDVHNQFLGVFAELGPLGFLLIVWCFVAGARLGWRLFDTARSDFARGVGRGVAMMWGAAAIGNMFGDRIRWGHLAVVVWSLTGLAFALLVKEERERAEEAVQLPGTGSLGSRSAV